MKKVIVLIENLFDEQELVYPYHRLREDFDVHLVGPEKQTEFSGKSGFKMKSTHSSAEVKAEDYEGIIIPGGFSPDYMRKSEATRIKLSRLTPSLVSRIYLILSRSRNGDKII